MFIQRLFIATCILTLAACSGNSNSTGGNSDSPDSGVGAPNQEQPNNPNTPNNAGAGNEQHEEAPPAAAQATPVATPSVSLNPGLMPNYQLTPQTLTPNYGTINPGFLKLMPHRALIHSSQCHPRESRKWQGPSQGTNNFYADTVYLCSVDLPLGAKVTKITLYPHNFSTDEDPQEVGAFGLNAAAGQYGWTSDVTAKAVTLKDDKSGYTTGLVPNCSTKDWAFNYNLPPVDLSCDFTQTDSNRLYFNIRGFAKTIGGGELPAGVDVIPPVVNLISVEYQPGK